MFTAKELQSLQGLETLRGKYGFIARRNTDGFVSLILQKKISGQRSAKSRTVSKVYPYGSDIKPQLTAAHKKALEWISLMDSGIDPKDHEKKLQKESRVITLGYLLSVYEESRHSYGKGNQPKTMKDRRNTIVNVFGDWFDTDISKIDKEMLLNRFHSIAVKKNLRPQAQKSIRYIRSLFSYAIDTMDALDKNPCDFFKNKISMKPKANKEYLLPSECKELLRYLDSFVYRKGDTFSLVDKYDFDKNSFSNYHCEGYNLIKLLLLSGLRSNEVLNLRWDQVHIKPTELSDEPYFEIIKSKQKEPFGIPITKLMLPIFKEQEKRKGGRNRIINLANVDLYDENDNNRIYSEFVFPSSKPYLHNGKLKDAARTRVRQEYDVINKLIGKPSKANKISSNVLRNTFATIAHTIGYTMDEISMCTGHTSRMTTSNVATDSYVARIAEANRDRFSQIHKAFQGELIKDDQIQEIPDKIEKQLDNMTRNELLELYQLGIMTNEEQEKYNVLDEFRNKLLK